MSPGAKYIVVFWRKILVYICIMSHNGMASIKRIETTQIQTENS